MKDLSTISLLCELPPVQVGVWILEMMLRLPGGGRTTWTCLGGGSGVAEWGDRIFDRFMGCLQLKVFVSS